MVQITRLPLPQKTLHPAGVPGRKPRTPDTPTWRYALSRPRVAWVVTDVVVCRPSIRVARVRHDPSFRQARTALAVFTRKRATLQRMSVSLFRISTPSPCLVFRTTTCRRTSRELGRPLGWHTAATQRRSPPGRPSNVPRTNGKTSIIRFLSTNWWPRSTPGTRPRTRSPTASRLLFKPHCRRPHGVASTRANTLTRRQLPARLTATTRCRPDDTNFRRTDRERRRTSIIWPSSMNWRPRSTPVALSRTRFPTAFRQLFRPRGLANTLACHPLPACRRLRTRDRDGLFPFLPIRTSPPPGPSRISRCSRFLTASTSTRHPPQSTMCDKIGCLLTIWSSPSEVEDCSIWLCQKRLVLTALRVIQSSRAKKILNAI